MDINKNNLADKAKAKIVESVNATGKRLEDVTAKPYLKDGGYLKDRPYLKFGPYREIIVPFPPPYKKINPVAGRDLKESASYIEFEGVLDKDLTAKLANAGCKLTDNRISFEPANRAAVEKILNIR